MLFLYEEIMLTELNDCIGKRCVIGLSYFDINGEALKQNMLAGEVINADAEQGITIKLLSKQPPSAQFIIPATLSCWFIAPTGEYRTNCDDLSIKNPDYLITWNIFQTKQQAVEGEQQWWEWIPNTQNPNVGAKK